MGPNDANQLAVLIERMRGETNEKLARIEERQVASRQIMTELAEKVETLALKEDVDALAERVGTIETTHRRIVAGALVGSSVGGGILYAIGRKLGLTS